MDLDLGSEQRLLLDSVEHLLDKYRTLPQPQGPDYFVYGETFDNELRNGGFYGDADGFSLSRIEAGLLLEQIAQCPYAVPAMASLIVAPAVLPASVEWPVALLSSSHASGRFLAEAKTALIDDGDAVLMLDLANARVEPLTTIFAYPYARLEAFDRGDAQALDGVQPEAFRAAWRLGLAWEILGALEAAHALTIDYVKQREQFKRPIGSFQAVQHRLSEGATRIEAVRYLVSRASLSDDPAEIALAASYAQEAIPTIVYNCHQFHGAMGLTLEYSLHHWTYRLKVLAGELGGAAAQGSAAADALWGGEHADNR